MKRHWILLLPALLLVPGSAGKLHAAHSWWQHDPATPGDWFDADNWTAGVPTGVAYINNGGTALIADGTATVTTAYVGLDTPSTCRVVQTGGALMGSTSTYNWIQLGYAVGTHGEYELSGDGYLQTWQLMLGDKGTGVFRQSGGTVNASVFTAMNATATGIYEMAGGGLNAPYFEMCGEGYGRFTLTDGTVTAGNFHVGYSFGEALCELQGGSVTATLFSLGTGYTWGAPIPPSRGTGTLTGTGQLSADTVSIGGYGPGEFTQTGGTLVAQEDLYVAYKIEGLGTGPGKYRIEGGAVNANRVHVGHGGQGALEVVGPGGDIAFASYAQTSRGRLVSEIGAPGLSTIHVTGSAHIAGPWDVLNDGAAYGRYDILTARGGISGSFDSVSLPGTPANWSWGIDDRTTLWVGYVPLEVLIDIKPGGEPNSINVLANGLLPVAVLGSDTFDVSQIDQGTLALAESTPQERGNSGNFGAFEDVNGDGFLDLTLRFPIGGLVLEPGDVEGMLSGELLDGTIFEGSDSVRLLRPGDANLDGFVDIQDFDIMKGNFAVGAGWSEGDFNEDGLVDIQDFAALKDHFGTGGAGVSAVPEPASATLLLLGLPWLIRYRRK